MDKVYISWTIENIITVTLMVALGYFLVAAVASVVRKRISVSGLAQATPGMGTGANGVFTAQSLGSGG